MSEAGSDVPAPPPPPATPRRGGVRGLVADLLAFDRRAFLILLYVPFALILLEYVFIPEIPYKRPNPAWTHDLLRSLETSHRTVPHDLWPLLWWASGCVLFLIVVPLLLLRFGARTRHKDVGLRVKGTGRDAWMYLALFVVFAPVVWAMSLRSDFRATYPFYRPPSGALGWDYVAFEAAYALQFLGVETFFRGVMVLGLKPALGRASVLVMIAPYAMIHFHKPMLESCGAIGAGLVLGSLSWRTGTVIWGWFLHYAVALSMDLLSLHAMGRI